MASPQLVAAWLVVAALQLASTAPAPVLDNSIVTAQVSDRAALAPVFGKRFRLHHCDNMAGFLEVAGLNKTVSTTLAETLTFSLSLDEKDGEYTLTSDIYIKFGDIPVKFFTSEVPFRIGQEIELLNVDGTAVKAVITQDSNILTETRKGKNPGTTIRIFTLEHVKTSVKIEGAVNNCVYNPE